LHNAGSVAKELAALAKEYCDGKGGKVALLGTAEQIDDIPAPIRAIFRHEINLPTPGTIEFFLSLSLSLSFSIACSAPLLSLIVVSPFRCCYAERSCRR
jgi:hypothetical protein